MANGPNERRWRAARGRGRAFGSFPAMILPGLQISLARLQPLALAWFRRRVE